jgi:hypothetical protein
VEVAAPVEEATPEAEESPAEVAEDASTPAAAEDDQPSSD